VLRLTVKILALGCGLLCHGLFATGIGLMALSLYRGMQIGWGPLHGGAAWATNVLLVLQFPLLHSLFLTDRGRSWLGKDLATTSFVIVAAGQLCLTFGLWSPSGVVWWSAQGAMRWLLTGLFAAAWLLLGKAMADAGLSLQTGTLGWWSVFCGRKPRYPPMPTTGLFTFSRQPIYLAFSLTLWTGPVWSPDQLLIASVWSGYCLIGPLHKEQRFRRYFGEQFIAYQQQAPYWLPRPPRRRNDVHDRAQ
jgi:protein-S-isoprenylcysteine O-methyltransferase Ste14